MAELAVNYFYWNHFDSVCCGLPEVTEKHVAFFFVCFFFASNTSQILFSVIVIKEMHQSHGQICENMANLNQSNLHG